MSLTSGDLEAAAERLHGLARSVSSLAEKHATEHRRLGGTIDPLAAAWVSPRSEEVGQDLATIVGQLDPVAGALEAASSALSRLARTATTQAAAMRRAERAAADAQGEVDHLVRESHKDGYSSSPGPAFTDARGRLDRARDDQASIAAAWTEACRSAEPALNDVVTTIRVAGRQPEPAIGFPATLTWTDGPGGGWLVEVADGFAYDHLDAWELLHAFGLVGDPRPRDAARMREVLSELDPAQLLAVAEAFPEAVGAMDGMPAHVRDVANRILLDREMQRLQDAGEDHGREWAALQRWSRDADLTLLLFDPDRGQVALARGDVDGADRVATLVPGAETRIRNLGDYYEQWLDNAHTLTSGKTGEDVATVLWLGYGSPPSVGDAASPVYAVAGAPALTSFLDGVVPDGATSTLVGHSYGGVVAAHGGRDLNVDTVVMLATPGTTRRLPGLHTFGDDITVVSGVHRDDPIRLAGALPAIHGSDAGRAADHVIDLGEISEGLPSPRGSSPRQYGEAGADYLVEVHMEYLMPETAASVALADLLAGRTFETASRNPFRSGETRVP